MTPESLETPANGDDDTVGDGLDLDPGYHALAEYARDQLEGLLWMASSEFDGDHFHVQTGRPAYPWDEWIEEGEKVRRIALGIPLLDAEAVGLLMQRCSVVWAHQAGLSDARLSDEEFEACDAGIRNVQATLASHASIIVTLVDGSRPRHAQPGRPRRIALAVMPFKAPPSGRMYLMLDLQVAWARVEAAAVVGEQFQEPPPVAVA
jgi:hypothetical protein